MRKVAVKHGPQHKRNMYRNTNETWTTTQTKHGPKQKRNMDRNTNET